MKQRLKEKNERNQELNSTKVQDSKIIRASADQDLDSVSSSSI
jgi:hypothetical protein